MEVKVLRPVTKGLDVTAAAADIGACATPGGRCVLMPDEEEACIAGWRELGTTLFAGSVAVVEGSMNMNRATM